MPKKTPPPPRGEVILQANMETVMRDSMLPYAEHVILDRALPRVEDGLKPVQRRILYTMSELGLTPDKPHRKCARIVGDCLGKYHPHGDSSVYDALVRLAQPFSMRGPFVDGHGNFGSIDGDTAAAMRYTEARMAPLALEMLRDIDKDTVPFSLNFDDTLREPDVLPARFPNLLVNGASGIAVGLATSIPPHNPGEAIDACVAQIRNPDITTAELMKLIPGPDFPTGGVLLDTPELAAAYETGRGKLTLRAKVHFETASAGRTLIVITDVPYQVSKAAMLEKILKLTEEKKSLFSCIHDIRDESDRTGLRAVVELKKEADPQKTLAALYKYSDLQVTFGVNMMAIAGGKPVQLGLKDVIGHFLKHQENVVTRRTRYDLDQAKARLHILDGLIIAVDNLDEVIRIIRAAHTDKEAKANLIAAFAFSDAQAQAILDLRLRRLTGLEIEALRKEHAQTVKLVKYLESILASRKKLMGVIEEELLEIRSRFADPRRTEILPPDDASDKLPEISDKPEAEEAVILYTREGRLRRMYPKWYEKLQNDAEPAEEKDQPQSVFSTMSDATLWFFTDLGNCYLLPASALPEANRPKDKGTLLSGLLAGLEKEERCVRILCLRPEETASMPDLVFFTRQGLVKRSVFADYQVRKSKFAALTLRGDDRLADVQPLTETHVLLISERGMAIRFPADQIPVNGRTASGVKGIVLSEGDRLGFPLQVADDEGEILLISDRGYAKKALVLDFETQNRPGKGVHCFTFQKNGVNGAAVAGALYVRMPIRFTIRQRLSPPTVFSSEDVPIELRAGKGTPFVAALLDDTVTEIEETPGQAEEAGQGGV